jgi:hypothetical protein
MPPNATVPTSAQQLPLLPSPQESGQSLPFRVAIADAGLEIAARNQKRGRRRRRHPDTTNDKPALQNVYGRSSSADPPDSQDRAQRGFERSATAHKEAGTGISFFITKAQKAELRRLGYSEEQIREMKPEDAHKALGLIS